MIPNKFKPLMFTGFLNIGLACFQFIICFVQYNIMNSYSMINYAAGLASLFIALGVFVLLRYLIITDFFKELTARHDYNDTYEDWDTQSGP